LISTYIGMSFYLDDDDDDYGNRLDPDTEEQEFVCPNCDSNDSYTDNAGTLFCSQCFSQSQTQQNEAELEYEDVQALVARGHGGRLVQARGARGRRSSMGIRKSRRKPLHTYDKSKPLPSIEECLRGYTVVIQSALKAVLPLLHLEQEQETIVMDAVRHTWLHYLKSWQEGADFYRSLHPEVRITMRDAFIRDPAQRHMLSRILTHRAMQLVKKERQKKEDEESDDDDDDKSDTKEDDGDEQEHEEAVEDNDMEPIQSVKAVANLSSVLELYKRRGRKEAALSLYPSMSMVASLFLSVLHRFGIAAPHLAKWIACGKLPLLNAYKRCLDENLQSKLEHVAYAFRMDRVPTTQLIEFQTKMLCIATDQEPKLVTPASIPLLTARLVGNLQFGPVVLNYALALMGETPQVSLQDTNQAQWLPTPLMRNADSRVHVLAAIAVACKLLPGFETRKFHHLCVPGMDTIPWNEDQTHLVAKSSAMASYLKFVEQHVMDGRNPQVNIAGKALLPDFLKDVDDNSNDKKMAATKRPPPPILMADTNNPNQPTKRNLSKYQAFKLLLRKQKAMWADTNGLGAYVVYNDPNARLQNCHPHYQLLLEVMGHTEDVKADHIHAIVKQVDKEVLFRCRPDTRTQAGGNITVTIRNRPHDGTTSLTFQPKRNRTKRTKMSASAIAAASRAANMPTGDNSNDDSARSSGSSSSSSSSSSSDSDMPSDEEFDLSQALI
jgi:hypothetical protein